MSNKTLDDQLDRQYAPAWKQQVGEKIVGELTAVDERLGYNDEPYPIITLRQGDGSERAVHAFHSVLRNELAKLNPRLGETIAIKYLGEVAKEGGHGRYHHYKVAIDREQRPVNLAKYADGEPDVEPDVPVSTAGLPDATENDGDVPF